MLARVVKKERPDLEIQKSELMTQQNDFKIKLKQIEDSLLSQLANAEGDLTENIELIENLEESKRISVEISEKAVIAAQTEIEINIAREDYRVVARRGALLFFMLMALVNVNALYQYSLSAFITVVERAIDHVELSEEESVKKRLNRLNKTITMLVWHVTRRGLLEKHKLPIVVQMLILILQKDDKIKSTELKFLMTSPKAEDAPAVPDNIASWMPEAAWRSLHKLRELEGFEDLAEDTCKSIKSW